MKKLDRHHGISPKDKPSRDILATEATLTETYAQQYDGTSLDTANAVHAVVEAARSLELKKWSGKDCPTYNRLMPDNSASQ
jgi:hypothetical protein